MHLARTDGGQPGFVCKHCFDTIEKEINREYAAEKRIAVAEKKADRELAMVGDRIIRKLNAPHISEACEEVIEQFNGLERFAEFYYTQLMIAAATNPGSKTVLDGCSAVLKFIAASTMMRGSAPDAEGMSDEELEREASALAAKGLTVFQEKYA